MLLSSCDTLDALDNDLLRMDAAVNLIRTQRALMARRRNALLPVSRLPLELMATIFHLASSERVRYEGTDWIGDWRSLAPDPLAAVTLSHVSHDFRRVALATATLWSTIDLSHAKAQIWQQLERARQAPFTVAVDKLTSKSMSLLSKILRKKRPVVRHLWLPEGYGKKGVTGMLQQLLDTALLESLHLDLRLWRHTHSDLRRLERLSLAGPISMIQSGPSPTTLLHLTKLSIKLDCVEPEGMIPMLSFLSSTPVLTELVVLFEDYGSDWDDDPEMAPALGLPNPSTFTCPLLRRIEVTGDQHCTLTLLYHLRPGPMCHVTLAEDIDSRHIGVLDRFLKRHSFGQDVVTACLTSREADGDISWKLYSPTPQSPDGSTVLEFETHHVHADAIASAIRWDGLRDLTLDLKHERRDVADHVLASVRHSPALASITVAGSLAAHCLCTGLLPDRAPDAAPMPFPALARVVLCHVDMRLVYLEQGGREGGMVLHAAKQRAMKRAYMNVVFQDCIFGSPDDLQLLHQDILSCSPDNGDPDRA
jgi:hypothetical protein